VLDVGCGGGQSTRDAARAAVYGSALGVDISEQMLERARRRRGGRPHNVAYQLGDAQVHPSPPAHFDIIISRFGIMCRSTAARTRPPPSTSSAI
jgi:ubiquinone/menaquinone biosynthesis C-methylase UbiE